MKATEQYLHMVLFIILYDLIFSAVNKTLTCDHSNETYLAVFIAYFALLDDANVLCVNDILSFKMKS